MILQMTDGASRIELRIDSGAGASSPLPLAGPAMLDASGRIEQPKRSRSAASLMLIGLAAACLGYGAGALSNGAPKKAPVAQSAGPAELDELPPELKRQLANPPIVTPPPSAPAAPAGKNPFGLE